MEIIKKLPFSGPVTGLTADGYYADGAWFPFSEPLTEPGSGARGGAINGTAANAETVTVSAFVAYIDGPMRGIGVIRNDGVLLTPIEATGFEGMTVPGRLWANGWSRLP